MYDYHFFDSWSGNYEKDILNSLNRYPFEKYYDVILKTLNMLKIKKDDVVLDLGCGSGSTTFLLVKEKIKTVSIDFSEEMLKKLSYTVPQAITIRHNITEKFPEDIKKYKPTKAVSTYVFHHFSDEIKIKIIKHLLSDILDNGIIAIGDVMFKNNMEFKRTRNKYIKIWDDSEYYIVYDDFAEKLKNENIFSEFEKIGECAGIISLYR